MSLYEIIEEHEPGNYFVYGAYGHLPLSGRLLRKSDRNGNTVLYNYRDRAGDATGNYKILDTITGDLAGATVTVGYRTETGPAPISWLEVTDTASGGSPKRLVYFDYNSTTDNVNTFLKKISYPDGCSTSYRLQNDLNGHTAIRAEIDPNNFATYFDYVGVTGALVRRAIEPDGRVTYFGYRTSAPYRTAMVVKDRPAISYFTYQLSGEGTQQGQLLKRLGLNGKAKYYQWDTVLNRTKRRMIENDATTYYEFNSIGEMTLIAESSGGGSPVYRRRQFIYNANGVDKRAEIGPRFVDGTMPDVTYFEYNSRGNPTQTIHPLNRMHTTVLTSVGKVRGRVDPRDGRTYYNFDATTGALASEVDRRDNTTSYKYNGFGEMTRVVSPRWAEQSALAFTTYFDYTQRSLLRRQINPLGQATYFDYDSRGDLIAEVDPRGVLNRTAYTPMRKVQRQWTLASSASSTPLTATYFAYNQFRNLHSVTKPINGTWSSTYFSYDVLDRPQIIIDPLGNRTYFAYDAVSNRTLARDALNRNRSAEYDLLGRRISTTDATTAKTYFGYDLGDLLVLRRDALGRSTTHDYDAAGRRFRTTDALTRQTYFGYDLNDNLVKVRDAANATTLQTFTPTDHLETLVNALNQQAYFGYDAADNLVKQRNARGHTTLTTYDRLDRLCTVTTPDTQFAYFGYDAVGNRTTVRDQRSHTSLAFYDGANRLVMARDALNGEVYYRYDLVGNVTERLDQRRKQTRFGYDKNTRMTKVYDALSNKTYFNYDAVGNRTSVVNPRNFATTFTYDQENRLQTATDARSGQTYFGYDAVGNRVKISDTLTRRITATYDNLNRVQTITNALSGVTYFGYDLVGNVVKVSDQLNRRTNSAFDLLRRLVTTTNAVSEQTYFGYDAVGNVTKVRNGLGNSTTMAYDSADRLTQVLNPLTQSVTFGYDAAGNRVKEVDGKNQPTYFAYDQLNRLTNIQGEQDQRTYFLYDAASNLTGTIVPGANRSDVAYDDLGRKRRVLDSQFVVSGTFGYGTQAYGTTPYGGGSGSFYQTTPSYFTYDAASNLTVTVDGTGTTTSTYDELNRETLRVGPKGTVYYGYDAVSNRTKVQYPGDNKRATYTFDALNRMTQIVSPDTKTTLYDHTVTSRVRKLRFGNNAVCYYNYDNADRVTAIRHVTSAGAAILTCDYRRDSAGRITTISRESDLAVYYQYDTADRLTKEIWAKRSTSAQIYAFSYSFDAAGNRTKMRREAATGVITESAYYTYDTANSLRKRWVAPANQATYYTYDRAGSLIRMIEDTNANTTYYEYGGHGLITAIKPPAAQGQPWHFAYDGRLNRTKIVKGDTPTYYCWDGMNQLEERDASGALVARYTHGRGPVYGVGSVVEVMRQTATTTYFQYLHMDHQGSVQAISDANQAITHQYVADGFGRQVVTTTGAATAVPNELRFQSNWIDIQVGTKRYSLSPARVFDHDLGGFRQADSLPNWIKVVRGVAEQNQKARIGHLDGVVFSEEIRYQARNEYHIISKYGPDYLINLWDASGFDNGGLPNYDWRDGAYYPPSYRPPMPPPPTTDPTPDVRADGRKESNCYYIRTYKSSGKLNSMFFGHTAFGLAPNDMYGFHGPGFEHDVSPDGLGTMEGKPRPKGPFIYPTSSVYKCCCLSDSEMSQLKEKLRKIKQKISDKDRTDLYGQSYDPLAHQEHSFTFNVPAGGLMPPVPRPDRPSYPSCSGAAAEFASGLGCDPISGKDGGEPSSLERALSKNSKCTKIQ